MHLKLKCKLAILLVGVLIFTGCSFGAMGTHHTSNGKLLEAEENFIYITLGENYAPEYVTLYLSTSNDKRYTDDTILEYDEDFGGYCALLDDEGSYRLIMSYNDGVNSSSISRYFTIDNSSKYYHIRLLG